MLAFFSWTWVFEEAGRGKKKIHAPFTQLPVIPLEAFFDKLLANAVIELSSLPLDRPSARKQPLHLTFLAATNQKCQFPKLANRSTRRKQPYLEILAQSYTTPKT